MKTSIFLLLVLITKVSSLCAHDYHTVNFYREVSSARATAQTNQRWEYTVTEKPVNNIFLSNFKSISPRDLVIARVTDLANIQNVSRHVLEYWCDAMSNEDLFERYHLYSNKNYLDYIRHRVGYEDFMLALRKKLLDNYEFRKTLRYMPGFKGKTGFQDFIANEANNIKNARAIRKNQGLEKALEAKRQAMLKCCKNLNTELTQNYLYAQEINNSVLTSRNQQRIDALNTTIKQDAKQFDYSKQVKKHTGFTDPGAPLFNNCYGTALDKQLHEELCETRTKVLHLQTAQSNNHHVQTISPVIYHVTALAKQESDLSVAFNLADAAHDLTDIMIYGVELLTKATCATARGLTNATKTVLSPQHWKDMGTGALKLCTFLVDQLTEQNKLDHAFLSLDKNQFDKACQDYYQYNQQLVKTTREHAKITLNKLHEMPWDELLEHGVEFGATLVLDTLAMNAAGYVASSAGRAMVSELAEIMKVTNPCTRESLVEISGVGKVALEEGTEGLSQLAESIECGMVHQKTALTESSKFSNIAQNILPDVKNAKIDIKKLTEYALNPEHPVGGHKAKVFARVLGYEKSKAEILMRQLYEKLPESAAILGKIDQYGQRYTVDMHIVGVNGNTAIVRTGWIVKPNSVIPELTTLYIK